MLPCKQRIAADTTATTDLSGKMGDRQKQTETLRYTARNTLKAKIIITPKKAVVDPQGKTVQSALAHMGYNGVGAVHVVSRYRDPAKNFRTRMLRIIKRAGLKPWPKLFHNLRASRETELAGAYPIHVVCSWIGNSALIAAKHYLQVTEDHFESAAKSGAGVLQNAVQQTAAPSGTDSQDLTEDEDACRVLQDDASRSNSLPIGQYAWRDSNPQPTAP